jgi:hypothetical protein
VSDELDNASGGLEGIVGSEHAGVRVWSVCAPTLQELIDRIAVILGEHMADGDQLHVSYNAMQIGEQLVQRPHLLRAPEQWTESFFEYSALLVLRGPRPGLAS